MKRAIPIDPICHLCSRDNESVLHALWGCEKDCFKTNYDGDMFDESDEAGLNVDIQNSEGQVMAALSKKIKKPTSVVTLELLAARRAAVFVSETGFQQSCFEGD
nr:hypothetical protein CFP56_43650 [Quercus suber]